MTTTKLLLPKSFQTLFDTVDSLTATCRCLRVHMHATFQLTKNGQSSRSPGFSGAIGGQTDIISLVVCINVIDNQGHPHADLSITMKPGNFRRRDSSRRTGELSRKALPHSHIHRWHRDRRWNWKWRIGMEDCNRGMKKVLWLHACIVVENFYR